MSKLFKKQSAIDTLVNVGIGGAANVAMDYVFGMIPAGTFGENEDTIKKAIKIGVGAIGGSMVGGKAAKYIRPAFDGIATVGASELISGLVASTGDDDPNKGGGDGKTPAPGGVPFIGKLRMGQRGFRRVGSVPFMEP